MDSLSKRKEILGSYTKNPSVLTELLEYNQNPFDKLFPKQPLTFPLESEKHISRWKSYKKESMDNGVFPVLQKKFPQFQFPIEEGINQTEEYKNVVLRGKPSQYDSDKSIALTEPQNLELVIHPTPVGEIPILIPGNRKDFEILVQTFAMRNEPNPVPKSMGACTLKGFNNWDRIHQYRKSIEEKLGRKLTEMEWQSEFKALIPQKDLYQDKFMILSRGPYSNVSAQTLGVEKHLWEKESLSIRLDHECVHYFTLRIFGITRNNLLDELMADFYGIVKTYGEFRKDYFLHFLGLESYPTYREGGRMENYLGEPPLSDSGFSIIRSLMYRAADTLENCSNNLEITSDRKLTIFLLTLAKMTLDELGSPEGENRILETFHLTTQIVTNA